jgi:hypothetical protein
VRLGVVGTGGRVVCERGERSGRASWSGAGGRRP